MKTLPRQTRRVVETAWVLEALKPFETTSYQDPVAMMPWQRRPSVRVQWNGEEDGRLDGNKSLFLERTMQSQRELQPVGMQDRRTNDLAQKKSVGSGKIRGDAGEGLGGVRSPSRRHAAQDDKKHHQQGRISKALAPFQQSENGEAQGCRRAGLDGPERP